MEKRVLMIGDTKSFMFNAILNGLRKESFVIEAVSYDVTALSHITDFPGIWGLYLDKNVEEVSETLVYIKDLIADKEPIFYLIGNHNDIEDVYKLIPEHMIRKAFERPLNTADFAAELNHASDEAEAALAKKRILIVDDDPAMTRMIKNLLSDRYLVFMAASGMNAITFLAKNQVDLILLDYEMPVISGAKVLEMIRSEPATSSIPVMFLTGKSDRESVMQVLALKPEKYLLKSMPPSEWLRSIDEFFSHHGS